MIRGLRRLAAVMYCGFCGEYTEVTSNLRCSECGR